MGSFYNHVLQTFHQLRQWATTGIALTDVQDPLENNGDYIPEATTNAFSP